MPFHIFPEQQVLSVQSAVVALPQGGPGTSDLFTVSGDVFLIAIMGVVTTTIGGVANATKLQVVCGALTAVDLCGTTDINGFTAGYVLNAVTSLATALGSGANGVAIGLIPVGCTIACGSTGTGKIRVSCAGADGGTGRVRWSCAYYAQSTGAAIVTA